LGTSGHAPRRLEAQNRCGASYFDPATLFLLLHFASLSHFHSCARYFFTIFSRSRCHFLSHAFSLAFCLAFLLMFSLVRGVLLRVLFSAI